MPDHPSLPPVKAMISYAWGTPSHMDRVQHLVDRLIGDGIDMVFDQYDLRDGDDVNLFMEQVAAKGDVKKVIAVCTPTYVQKMNAREGGSGQEGMIMSTHVYEQLRGTLNEQERQRKFIPVIFERDPELPFGDPGHRPIMFSSMKYIDLSTEELMDENYDQLLRFLLDRPEKVRPPLGTIPAHLREDAPAPLPGQAQAQTLVRRLEQGKPTDGAWNDYLGQVKRALSELKPAATLTPRTELDFQVMLDEAERFIPARDQFVSVLRQSLRSGEDPMSHLLPFFEDLLNVKGALQERHRDGSIVLNDVAFAHLDFLVWELVLYMGAVHIDERRLDPLKEFCEHTFFTHRTGMSRPTTYSEFCLFSQLDWLEQHYKAATGQEWTSAAGAWLKARATLESLPFSSLLQADLILMLKRALTRSGDEWGGWWVAHLGPYTELNGAPQLFTLWQSQKRLQPWLHFFDAPDGLTLKARLEKAFPENAFGNALRHRWSGTNATSLLGMAEWGKLN